MAQETTGINNKHAKTLLPMWKNTKRCSERLAEYNATVGDLDWDKGSWHFGEKGVTWLKETESRL